MKGFLVKREKKWFVKWSDLHSFAHGTHWMYTELSDDSNSLMYIKDGEVKYNVLKEDVEVEFEIITSGYDNKDFTPHNSAKLIFPEVEIFKKLKLFLMIHYYIVALKILLIKISKIQPVNLLVKISKH